MPQSSGEKYHDPNTMVSFVTKRYNCEGCKGRPTQPVARHSAMSPAETLKMSKRILTLSLTKPR